MAGAAGLRDRAWLQPFLENSPDRLALEGMLESVAYFASGAVKAATGPMYSYYDKLLELVEQERNPALPPKAKDSLRWVLSVIEENVPRNVRHRRTALYEFLNSKGWPPHYQVVWHTALEAWNWAVQASNARGGLTADTLPKAVPVAAFLGRPQSLLLPVAEAPDRCKALTLLDCDPAALNWEQLRAVIGETRHKRDNWHVAADSGDWRAANEALQDFADPVASEIARRRGRVFPYAGWLLWASLESILANYDATQTSIATAALAAIDLSLEYCRHHLISVTVSEAGRESLNPRVAV